MVNELLNKGKENAITTEELMRVLKISNKRDLTMQIARERNDGYIICSTTVGQGGYYLPQTKEEIREFVNSMDRRARNTFKAVKAARRCLREMEGQIDLDEIKS